RFSRDWSSDVCSSDLIHGQSSHRLCFVDCLDFFIGLSTQETVQGSFFRQMSALLHILIMSYSITRPPLKYPVTVVTMSIPATITGFTTSISRVPAVTGIANPFTSPLLTSPVVMTPDKAGPKVTLAPGTG